MKNTYLLSALLLTLLSFGQVSKNKAQDAIIEEFLTNGAEKYSYTYNMAEWQNSLDEGLKKDSTIARLWQQKAMPYFKCQKYEVGMQYLDKAVFYDKQEWLPYRAFIKCIFAKTYKEAIVDFEECIALYGNNYRMDHTYNFYIGISYLQLNEYIKAEKYLSDYVTEIYEKRDKLEHPTAYFYYGISKYEQNKWEDAIVIFDKALKIYPEFSDAKYYKAICYAKLGKKQEEIKALFEESKADFKKGYSINEDNTAYETYPYQKKWRQ